MWNIVMKNMKNKLKYFRNIIKTRNGFEIDKRERMLPFIKTEAIVASVDAIGK
jgi:hypothetical protein